MSDGTTIIQGALKRIGAHSIAAPAAPETIIDGLDALNPMMQMWLSQGINLNIVPLNAPGEDLGEPADSTNAIMDNLAIQVAPLLDNGKVVVSKELKDNARRGYEWVKTLYRTHTIPKKVPSGTLPRGQGERHDFIFFGNDQGLKSDVSRKKTLEEN